MALLAVLWLSVALTMIAMTTAYLVRSEAAAVSNHMASERAEFLALGGINAAIYAILHASASAEPSAAPSAVLQQFQPGQRWMKFQFQDGSANVEVMPENAKLSVNVATTEQLAALFALLGERPEESQQLAQAIVEWRSPRATGVRSPLDDFYEGLATPYTQRHRPFTELEELLAVKGMSRDLFYGRLIETAAGVQKRTPPLADLLSTDSSFGGVNVIYARSEVLRVLPGWSDALVEAVLDGRSRMDAKALIESVPGLSEAAGLSPITLSPGLAYTITAIGAPNDMPVQHDVRARILLDSTAPLGYRVTGWWEDWPWSGTEAGGNPGA